MLRETKPAENRLFELSVARNGIDIKGGDALLNFIFYKIIGPNIQQSTRTCMLQRDVLWHRS
jgi:hypothetical protein